MCSSNKHALSDGVEFVKLCVCIMDDQCKSEEWSKENVLNHVKNKLMKAYTYSEVTNKTYEEECDEIINHGTFSESVISKLLKNGISKEDIIKIMKYGLEILNFEQIYYFHALNLTEKNLKYGHSLLNDTNGELMEKLKTIGFNDDESSDIIMKGLVNQNECYHFRLSSHNVIAAKILNWQGPITRASYSVIEFLEQLGLDECTVKIVSEKGISTEAQDMIKGLGYTETSQRRYSKDLEPLCNSASKFDIGKSDSESIRCSSNSISHSSQVSEMSQKCENCERKNFIRQNLTAPLTWAISRTLQYNPTDPVHYIACQLLRWKHKNVDPSEMKEVIDFVNDAVVNYQD